MKSLKRRFDNVTEKNPNLSSYTCFARTITGQGFNKQTIHRWFQKLVDKEDYLRKEKRGLLTHLDNLSNCLSTTKIEAKTALQPIRL